MGQFERKFQGEGSSTNHFWRQKTRVAGLSRGVVCVILSLAFLMYRLNVQVTAYGQQTVHGRGVVRPCDPLQNFGGSNHITAGPKVVKLCTRVGYISSSNRMTYHQEKGVDVVT